MSQFTRRRTRVVAVLGAVVATMALAGSAATAQADDDINFLPTVGLSVDAPNQLVGGVATLHASTMFIDIRNSPYYVKIYDVTTQTQVASCGITNDCTAQVSQNVATQHTYRAYIAGYSSAFPPTNIQAVSNDVVVRWGAKLVLNADRTWMFQGETANLTAKAAVAGPITIRDATTGQLVKTCPSLFTVSCSVSVTNIPSYHTYYATQAGLTSSTVTVQWEKIPA